jgi:surface antigen
MALGRSLILITTVSTAQAGNLFEYNSNVLFDSNNVSFGMFKKLDDAQMEAYTSSMVHAIMYADNGQKVEWYKGNASGYTVPLYTKTTGSGYCKHIQAVVVAYGTVKEFSQMACYDNALDRWRWQEAR